MRDDRADARLWTWVAVEMARRTGEDIGIKSADRYPDLDRGRASWPAPSARPWIGSSRYRARLRSYPPAEAAAPLRSVSAKMAKRISTFD